MSLNDARGNMGGGGDGTDEESDNDGCWRICVRGTAECFANCPTLSCKPLRNWGHSLIRRWRSWLSLNMRTLVLWSFRILALSPMRVDDGGLHRVVVDPAEEQPDGDNLHARLNQRYHERVTRRRQLRREERRPFSRVWFKWWLYFIYQCLIRVSLCCSPFLNITQIAHEDWHRYKAFDNQTGVVAYMGWVAAGIFFLGLSLEFSKYIMERSELFWEVFDALEYSDAIKQKRAADEWSDENLERSDTDVDVGTDVMSDSDDRKAAQSNRGRKMKREKRRKRSKPRHSWRHRPFRRSHGASMGRYPASEAVDSDVVVTAGFEADAEYGSSMESWNTQQSHLLQAHSFVDGNYHDHNRRHKDDDDDDDDDDDGGGFDSYTSTDGMRSAREYTRVAPLLARADREQADDDDNDNTSQLRHRQADEAILDVDGHPSAASSGGGSGEATAVLSRSSASSGAVLDNKMNSAPAPSAMPMHVDRGNGGHGSGGGASGGGGLSMSPLADSKFSREEVIAANGSRQMTRSAVSAQLQKQRQKRGQQDSDGNGPLPTRNHHAPPLQRVDSQEREQQELRRRAATQTAASKRHDQTKQRDDKAGLLAHENRRVRHYRHLLLQKKADRYSFSWSVASTCLMALAWGGFVGAFHVLYWLPDIAMSSFIDPSGMREIFGYTVEHVTSWLWAVSQFWAYGSPLAFRVVSKTWMYLCRDHVLDIALDVRSDKPMTTVNKLRVLSYIVVRARRELRHTLNVIVTLFVTYFMLGGFNLLQIASKDHINVTVLAYQAVMDFYMCFVVLGVLYDFSRIPAFLNSVIDQMNDMADELTIERQLAVEMVRELKRDFAFHLFGRPINKNLFSASVVLSTAGFLFKFV